MRVAFFGSTPFSCLIFKALWESHHEVVAVVTQPDQPAGRSMALCPTAMCQHVESAGVPVLKPAKLRSNPAFRAELMEHQPEAFMVASYGRIISKKVLDLTEFPLNVHPSSLPHLRGASPVRTSLLQGLRETECCIMRMTPRLDDGDVMLREPFTIESDWNFAETITHLGEVGGELAVKALDQAADGSATFTPQDHQSATHSTMYTRDDTVIDWSRTATGVKDFVRAWDPDWGALTGLPCQKRFKLWRVAVQDPPQGTPPPKPGVIAAVTRKAFWVGCGEGYVRVLEVQPESKPRMPAGSFLAGNKLEVGDQLGTDCGM